MEQYNTLHINNLEFKEYVNPMYLEALVDNSTVSLVPVDGWSGKTFRISKTNALNSYYDYDWSDITLNEGERVYWYSGQAGQYSVTQYVKFVMTGRFKVGGNIQSLMNYSTSVVEYGFYKLFVSCSVLVDASDLLLPATTLADCCYRNMFGACASLITPPAVISATTLTDSCCQEMFYNCISMTTAPELPATTLAHGCYNTMFYNCRSMTTAPAILPATTLAYFCYQNMFYNCRSLTTAPELPAPTFPVMTETSGAPSCYIRMFHGCSSLNYIKCMLDEYPTSNTQYYMDGWVQNVSPTGTFVKSPNATWETGMSGIPNGWTVVDAS